MSASPPVSATRICSQSLPARPVVLLPCRFPGENYSSADDLPSAAAGRDRGQGCAAPPPTLVSHASAGNLLGGGHVIGHEHRHTTYPAHLPFSDPAGGLDRGGTG